MNVAYTSTQTHLQTLRCHNQAMQQHTNTYILKFHVHQQAPVHSHGQKLETVTSFKYLGSIITDEGSKPEILSPG